MSYPRSLVPALWSYSPCLRMKEALDLHTAIIKSELRRELSEEALVELVF